MTSTPERIFNNIHKTSKQNTVLDPKQSKTSLFLRYKNEKNEIVKSFEFSNTERISSKHSIFQNNIPEKKRYFDESTKNLLFFLILRLILCSLLFWVLSILFLFLQIGVNDLCFYPEHCQCANIFVYVYSMIRDFFCGIVPGVLLTYYGFSFVTDSFYQKLYFQNIYVTNSLIATFFFYGYDYESRFESIKFLIWRRNIIIFLIMVLIYVFLVTYASHRFDKEFLTRLTVTGIFLCFLLFHIFYMKPYFVLYSLDYLQEIKSISKNYELLKIFLLLYNLFYWKISLLFFSYFYRKITKEGLMSLNIIIFLLKFVLIDVWEVMLLNALTSSLNEVYGWIHMSIYFYSILANYTRKNLIVSVISQFYLCFSKKKTVKKSAMNWKNFNDLVCSCVLQGNLIIIFRVETYKVFGYFIILTKTFQNYLDCTLKEQKGSFEIYDWNSWIACLTHLVIFVGSILWLMKRNLKKIVFVEEDVHLIFKMIYFLIMFIFSDQGLQCYKEFIERMKK